jgi:phosphoglycolate phosphatase-like HAD superfamily hydrolase
MTEPHEPAESTGGTQSAADSDSTVDERWLVVNGRRWRRTDPSLPSDVVDALTSHLGRARSAVGAASRRGDAEAVAAARRRVGLAKHGLGERGPRWWDEPEPDRLRRARTALDELDADAGSRPHRPDAQS